MLPTCNGRRGFLMVLAAFAATTGCSGGKGDRPKTVPVTGTVLHNGRPVEGAHVSFFSPEKSATAYGRTGTDGRFRLTTFDEGDGAVIDVHKVSIMKREVVGELRRSPYTGQGEPPPGYEEIEDQPPPETRSLLPEHYANAETSNLTAEVTDGGDNDFKFELADN